MATQTVAAPATEVKTSCARLETVKTWVNSYTNWAFQHTVEVINPKTEAAKDDECGCCVKRVAIAALRVLAAIVLTPFALVHHAYTHFKGEPKAEVAAADKAPATKKGWFS